MKNGSAAGGIDEASRISRTISAVRIPASAVKSTASAPSDSVAARVTPGARPRGSRRCPPGSGSGPSSACACPPPHRERSRTSSLRPGRGPRLTARRSRGRPALHTHRRTTNMCSYVIALPTSSSMPTPPSASSTGRPHPRRWPRRPRPWATRRWRSPTTTGSADRWPSPTRPGRRGCGPSRGPSSRCADGSHLTLLAATRGGLRQPLPAHHPRPRAHAPPAGPPPAAAGARPRPPGRRTPRASSASPAAPATASCRGSWRRASAAAAEEARARAGARLRAGERPRRDPAPAATAATGAWRATSSALAEAAGRALRGDRRPPRPLARGGPAAGRLRGDRPSPHPRRLRGRPPRQPPGRAAAARRDGRPLRRPPRRRWPRRLRIAERLEFDLTRDLGYRFPDFVGSHPGETAQARPGAPLRPPARRALPQRRASGRPPARGSTRSSR